MQCQVTINKEHMARITVDQYEFALLRYEELFLLVAGNPKADPRYAIEMEVMTNIVTEYEDWHFPTRS